MDNYSQVVTGNAYKNLGGGWTVTDSEYPFRIRFAPPRVGEWFCHIKVKILNQIDYISPTFQFNVVNSTKKNYLKVDNNKRFLKQDGESFRPLGVNYPAPIREGYPLRSLKNGNQLVYRPEYHGQLPTIAHYEQYLRMMDTLAMNGANYFRMIMNPWSLDLEYEKLGDYSDRMHIAEEMDLILERAAANDMLIHWNLMIHFHFQENPFDIKIWDWTDENGGSGYCYKNELNLNSPIEFFTNETARAYYKERLRYIIARWGYSSDIAMFEHFSEIDQVGTKHDENGNAIDNTNQYAGNEEVINSWHGEMSWYLKEVLEIPQLLTLSYTTKHNEELDHSFWHGNIDVININNYNYFKGGVTPPHVYPFRGVTYNMFKNNEKGVYNKPVFYSEMGAHEVWDCDNNVENRRSIWQSYFLGVSGGLEWHFPADLSIYSRVNSFIEGVDLEGGNWHPGAFDRENDGEWKFNDNYHDDCVREDELADVVYLRSGDKNKAFGVITNRRANYYTLGEGECTEDNEEGISAPPDGLLRTYGTVTPGSGSDRLRIRNMRLAKEYKIKYYSPYDQVNSIREETRWGPKLTLEFPDMDTLDIILFEVFRMGEDFKSKSMQSDTTDSDITLTREPKKKVINDVIVFPNPNDGNFVITIGKPTDVKEIHISDNLGKRIDSRHEIFYENHYNKTIFNSGVYFVEVIFEDKIIRKKFVITK